MFWVDDDREALEHCYFSKTEHSNALKTRVFAALSGDDLSLCPYCLLRSPNEIDHFLPISKFPEFGVFGANLVWVCGDCNNKKSDGLFQNPRSILNPYFDDIPTAFPILFCRVLVRGEELMIEFGIPGRMPGVADEVLAVAQRHCASLNLFKAYVAEAGAMISALLRELASRFPQGIAEDELAREIQHQRARRPPGDPVNHWTMALWDAVDANADFYLHAQAFIRQQRAVAPAPRPERRSYAHLITWTG